MRKGKILSCPSDFSFMVHPERIEWFCRDTLLSKKGYSVILLAPYSQTNKEQFPDRFDKFLKVCDELYDDIYLFPMSRSFRDFLSLKPSYAKRRIPSKMEIQSISKWLDNHIDDLVATIVEISFAFDTILPFYGKLKDKGVPILLRMENIERDFAWYNYRRMSLKKKLFDPRFWFMFADIIKLIWYEPRVVRLADKVFCLSTEDTKWCQKKRKDGVYFVPYWYQLPESMGIPFTEDENATLSYIRERYNGKKVMFLVNNFRDGYNVREVKWFIDKVFPEIKKNVPEVIFLFGGYDVEKYFGGSSLPDGVEMLGEIASVRPYMEIAHLVPLLSKSSVGVKIKLVEALFFRKNVVAFPEAVKGSGVEEYIPQARNEHEWVEACISILRKEKDCSVAWENFENLYDHYKNIAFIENFFKKV